MVGLAPGRPPIRDSYYYKESFVSARDLTVPLVVSLWTKWSDVG